MRPWIYSDVWQPKPYCEQLFIYAWVTWSYRWCTYLECNLHCKWLAINGLKMCHLASMVIQTKVHFEHSKLLDKLKSKVQLTFSQLTSLQEVWTLCICMNMLYCLDRSPGTTISMLHPSMLLYVCNTLRPQQFLKIIMHKTLRSNTLQVHHIFRTF